MLSDRCLSCLSVTLVHCGQTVWWIKVQLGTAVGLRPGDIVLDKTHLPTERGTAASYFSAHVLVAERSPISATAELLFSGAENLRKTQTGSPPKEGAKCRWGIG